MFSILLVEDEKLELETLRDYVDWKKLGASKVYTARNGRTALDQKGSVAYFDEKVSLADMKESTELLCGYKDRMFYGERGEVVCIPERDRIEFHSEGFDREAWNQSGQKLQQEILAGSEEGAGQALAECMEELRPLGREDCQREAYGLYLNLYNRLELDNASLMNTMEKRTEKPELSIWDAGFFLECNYRVKSRHKIIERRIWNDIHSHL